MKIGSINEDLNLEKRISITPSIAKKITELGLKIFINENYAEHLGINDREYKNIGVNILKDKKEVIQISDLSLLINFPESEYLNFFKENSSVIGIFNSQSSKEKINILINRKVNIFSMDLLPRITRAQSMDVLSSQANLAGYKATIESINRFEKVVPMMMTAAGTIPAARVLVVGAGVAGLQAIATAKRLGSVVFATDVRLASKEQVESLGGKFLTVPGLEDLETEAGYAKEAGKDFKLKQEELLKKTLKTVDIVICTALVPGKKAPRILNEEMVKNMKSGSIIYDLAIEQGGNSAYSELDKIVEINGIKIIGYKNILNKLPLSASSLYSKNLFNFFNNLYNKKNKKIDINLEDEIISKTLIKKKF